MSKRTKNTRFARKSTSERRLDPAVRMSADPNRAMEAILARIEHRHRQWNEVHVAFDGDAVQFAKEKEAENGRHVVECWIDSHVGPVCFIASRRISQGPYSYQVRLNPRVLREIVFTRGSDGLIHITRAAMEVLWDTWEASISPEPLFPPPPRRDEDDDAAGSSGAAAAVAGVGTSTLLIFSPL